MKKVVTIIRKPYFPDYYRNYKVYHNNKFIGKIARDSEFVFEINHKSEIFLRIDWCRSNKIMIDDSFSENIKLEVYPATKDWKLLFYFYYITFGINKYLNLKILEK